MATDKTVLRREDGVSLTRVDLRQNGQLLESAYVVAGDHTPQTWSFEHQGDAIERFEKEVEGLAKGER